ncbi:MAG: DUF4386 domain-containing protein [Anaerolineae bacterium]
MVPGDAATTFTNLLTSEGLFRLRIVGFLLMLAADAVVAWALYVVLRLVSQSLSLLAAVFRWVYTTIHGAALLNLVSVLRLVSGADASTALGGDLVQAQALRLLQGHNDGFLIGLVFFGVHLALLGYLVFRTGYLPRVLGVLLVLAAGSYVLDSLVNFLLTNYADYVALFLLIVAVPSIIAELSLCLWLLLKGANANGRNSHTAEPFRVGVG